MKTPDYRNRVRDAANGLVKAYLNRYKAVEYARKESGARYAYGLPELSKFWDDVATWITGMSEASVNALESRAHGQMRKARKQKHETVN